MFSELNSAAGKSKHKYKHVLWLEVKAISSSSQSSRSSEKGNVQTTSLDTGVILTAVNITPVSKDIGVMLAAVKIALPVYGEVKNHFLDD